MICCSLWEMNEGEKLFMLKILGPKELQILLTFNHSYQNRAYPAVLLASAKCLWS